MKLVDIKISLLSNKILENKKNKFLDQNSIFLKFQKIKGSNIYNLKNIRTTKCFVKNFKISQIFSRFFILL
jgi:hypothetical protein